MTLDLYTCTAPNNQVDKTGQMTLVSSLPGEVRGPMDFLDPTFYFYAGTAYDYNNVNYIYCQELDRYYFIRDLSAERTRLVKAVCHEDVLNSFKNQIRKNTAIIERQQTQNSLYIEDSEITAYQNQKEGTLAFNYSFGAHDGEKQSFVMLTAGSTS